MPTALVVDDDPDLRSLARLILDRAGYDVWTEADGDAGWWAATRLHPDVALLDWLLPGRSGLELCRAFREESSLRSTPVVIVSSRDQEYEIELGFGARADGYLTKPFTSRSLLLRVDEARAARGPGLSALSA